MPQTFRDLIDRFPDRSNLAAAWTAKLSRGKVEPANISLWYHRDGVPGWSWSALVAAAEKLGVKGVTLAKLSEADQEARKRRALNRKPSADQTQQGSAA